MSDSVFIPQSSPGVYLRDGEDCHKHMEKSHSHRPHHEDLLALHLAARIDDDTRQCQQEVCNSSRHVADKVNDEASDVRRSVRDEGLESRDSIEKFGLQFLNSLERSSYHLSEGICSAKEKIADYGYRNLLEAKELQKNILKEACDTREIVREKTCGLERQAADNKAALELNCLKNALETQKQISESMCCLKSLILEKAHCTEDLIRKVENDRLKQDLDDAREDARIIRLRATLTPALVPSISP